MIAPVRIASTLSCPIKLQNVIRPNGRKTACNSAALISLRTFLIDPYSIKKKLFVLKKRFYVNMNVNVNK